MYIYMYIYIYYMNLRDRASGLKREKKFMKAT